MGYHTDFNGSFDIIFNDKTKEQEVVKLVNGLNGTRRVKRDMSLANFPLKKPAAYYGVEGEFYVTPIDCKFIRKSDDITILNHNYPPSTQPGLWLQWIIEDHEDDSFTLEWDGEEKFYNYIAWLEYLIKKIFIPANAVLNGEVEYRGEDWTDTGFITIKDNIVTST